MTAFFRRPIVIAALVALAVAVLGGSATRIGPWYESLEKPSFNPPNWLFAPAWTLIYALAVLAAVRAWSACRTVREQAWLLSLFFVNAVLNVLWSLLFFSARRPDLALAEVIVLWISVLALVIFIRRRDAIGSLALLPYLFWVGFAGVLNYRIAVLNGPF